LESFVTVAVNRKSLLVTTLPVAAERLTTIAPGAAAATVIAAVAVFVPSATEVAVSTMLAGLGIVAGAV
jgi:hypothetical protein